MEVFKTNGIIIHKINIGNKIINYCKQKMFAFINNN